MNLNELLEEHLKTGSDQLAECYQHDPSQVIVSYPDEEWKGRQQQLKLELLRQVRNWLIEDVGYVPGATPLVRVSNKYSAFLQKEQLGHRTWLEISSSGAWKISESWPFGFSFEPQDQQSYDLDSVDGLDFLRTIYLHEIMSAVAQLALVHQWPPPSFELPLEEGEEAYFAPPREAVWAHLPSIITPASYHDPNVTEMDGEWVTVIDQSPRRRGGFLRRRR